MTELRITIAGHMNHGKTSIVRTLTDDIIFGVVGLRHPTNEVSKQIIRSNALEGSLEIYDTPGLELASAALAEFNEKPTFGGVVNYFKDLINKGKNKEFDCDRELETLEHIQSKPDVILYVVGLNQPLNNSYKDEYHILRISGVRVLPIFNFVGCKNSSKRDWEEFFESEGCFDFTDYDAHIWDPNKERLLWDRVKAKMQDEAKAELVEAWRDHRLKRMDEKDGKAASAIVKLLKEVAEIRIEWREEPTDDEIKKAALEDRHRREFENKVREIEVEKLNLILDAYSLKVGKIADVINAKTVLEGFGPASAGGPLAAPTYGDMIYLLLKPISDGAKRLFTKDKKTFTIKDFPYILEVVLCRALALTRDLRRRGFANDKEPDLASAKLHMPSDATPFLKAFDSSKIKTEEREQQVLKWIQQPFPESHNKQGV